MNNSDLHSNIKQVVAVLPTVLGPTGAIAGAIIDRRGYGGVEFLPVYGAVTTTGTIVTAILKEGDVTGTLTSVADADMIGTEALASLLAGARTAGTGKEVAKRLGYKGSKRYVQLTLDGTGTTSAGVVAAVAVMFNPTVAPISNP
jgi:hypothetical protein